MPLLKSDARAVALIRSVPRLPAEVQIEMAREHGIDRRFIYVHGDCGGRDARDEWIKALGIGRNVVGWLPRIDVLIKRRHELPSGVRPSIDFMTTLGDALAKAQELVDASAGARSSKGFEWRPVVEWGAKQASAGVPKSLRKQREHGRRGGAIIKARSVVAKWSSDQWAKQRAAAAPMWRDPAHDNWKAAREALPEELHKLRYHSLWRIFGPRDPRKAKT